MNWSSKEPHSSAFLKLISGNLFSCFRGSFLILFVVFFLQRFSGVLLQPGVFRPHWPRRALLDALRFGEIHPHRPAEQLRVILHKKIKTLILDAYFLYALNYLWRPSRPRKPQILRKQSPCAFRFHNPGASGCRPARRTE